MKYIVNYIKVISQLLVLPVVKIWKKLSRTPELNSWPSSPKLIRASQSLYQQLSHKHQRRRIRFRVLYDMYHIVYRCIVTE